MSTRPRRLVPALSLMLLLGACGSSAQATPDTTVAPSAIAPSESAAPAASPASSPGAGQTDTDWGRIWDTLPPGFPIVPGATPADDAGGEPVSARFAVEGGDPGAIATWLQDALEQATFSTLGFNGPGEDGGYVIDSAGDGDCRIQTTITPLGGTTFVAVRYGVGCPA
jgi:hypothetical protein